jgi:hypothetical protein
MRIFTALFDMAVLPIVIAKDVVMAMPDVMENEAPFQRTREQCMQIDSDLIRP